AGVEEVLLTKARRRAARGPLCFDDVARRLAAPVALAAALALMADACQSAGKGSTLVIVVTVSGSLPPISAVAVTLKAGSNRVSTQSYARADGQAIAFPTTL